MFLPFSVSITPRLQTGDAQKIPQISVNSGVEYRYEIISDNYKEKITQNDIQLGITYPQKGALELSFFSFLSSYLSNAKS